MKRILLSSLFAALGVCASAQDIVLPAPNMERGSKSVVETLATRHSVREFSDRTLTPAQISDLCWAANGVARDNDHRTAPSAMNRKEIRLFAFTEEGVYEYLATENTLKQLAKGDHRKLVAGTKDFSQDFAATAPISLVMVIDFERFGSSDERAMMMGCVDAGNVSENINLYCEAVGLCTVPRATMDVEGIRSLLGLSQQQLPIMNNPVGFTANPRKVARGIYNESADQMQLIDEALAKAKAEGKHVICQVGGNWCRWCLMFADFITHNDEIAKMIDENYVYIHVDYSDNSPQALKERLGKPGRFGFPVMVVLDADGNLLHMQDSSFLENGEGYNAKYVKRFLKSWTPEAMK